MYSYSITYFYSWDFPLLSQLKWNACEVFLSQILWQELPLCRPVHASTLPPQRVFCCLCLRVNCVNRAWGLIHLFDAVSGLNQYGAKTVLCVNIEMGDIFYFLQLNRWKEQMELPTPWVRQSLFLFRCLGGGGNTKDANKFKKIHFHYYTIFFIPINCILYKAIF